MSPNPKRVDPESFFNYIHQPSSNPRHNKSERLSQIVSEVVNLCIINIQLTGRLAIRNNCNLFSFPLMAVNIGMIEDIIPDKDDSLLSLSSLLL